MVKSLLSANDGLVTYEVVPMSRFADSKAARRFRQEYPDIVLKTWQEDSLDDLISCFSGCHGVFAQTDTYAFPLQSRRDWTDSEISLGQLIICAAEVCNVKHIVYSSLPSVFNASNGAHNIRHFEAKHHISSMFEESSIASTRINSGPFFTNIFTPQFSFYSGDTFILSTPANPQKTCGWVDPSVDIGALVLSVLSSQVAKENRSFDISGKQLSFAELARTFSSVTGFKARYVQCTIEEWVDRVCVPPSSELAATSVFRQDLEALGEWLATMPSHKSVYGTVEADEVKRSERLMQVKCSSWEAYLRRAKWLQPTKQMQFEKASSSSKTSRMSVRIVVRT